MALTFFAIVSLVTLTLALPLVLVIGRLILRRDLRVLGSRLLTIARGIDSFSERFGRGVSWLALAMVLVQTVVVVQRYVFGISWIWLQESVMYMYGLMFLLAAGYTLLHDGHVRVDIFYREAGEKTKALTNFLGTYLFLFPVMYVILDLGYPYFEISWRVKEASPETSGIPGIYVLKFAILAFATLMVAQAFSLAIRAAHVLIGETPSEPGPQKSPPAL